ncbi:hypothetical protein IJ531_02215, partial [bacterium]|nr:hypothetical protein [bacterium]
MTIDKKDVENLISRIKLKTKASDDTIKEVLYQLTLFSSYSSIDYLGEIAKEHFTNNFGVLMPEGRNADDFSYNSAINYLANSKRIFPEGLRNRNIIILDNMFLEELEESKEEGSNLYSSFIDNFKKGNTLVINLAGWDVKCLDNQYRSANFLLGSGYLEALAVDTIKRMNRGEDLDDILFGDFEDRLERIINSEVYVQRIKPIKKEGVITTDDICENLRRPELNEDEIKKVLKKARSQGRPKAKRSAYRNALSKFLDEYSIVYSNDSMAQDLIRLNRKIKQKYGKSKKDSAYLVANTLNSTSYITSIYAHLNNIPPQNIRSYTGYNKLRIAYFAHDKNLILLDDNSSTGTSIEDLESKVDVYKKDIKTNWAVLLATKEAIKRSRDKKYHDSPNSFSYLRELKSMNKEEDSDPSLLLTKEEENLLIDNLYWGYENSGTMCAFHHMIPDNCVDIAAVLFKNLLIKNNYETNRPLDDYESRQSEIKQGRLSFKGKLINEPDCNPLNCNYSDINEFSHLFSSKINSQ